MALIGDAAQAHGAEYKGTNIGNIGDMTCYSFFPSKIITVAGEGGMITCDDSELYENLTALKNHGRYSGERDVSSIAGFNFRLPEILAAAGLVQLKHMTSWIDRRREIASRYTEELLGIGDIVVPEEMSWGKHVYYLYVIRTPSISRTSISQQVSTTGFLSTRCHTLKETGTFQRQISWWMRSCRYPCIHFLMIGNRQGSSMVSGPSSTEPRIYIHFFHSWADERYLFCCHW